MLARIEGRGRTLLSSTLLVGTVVGGEFEDIR